MIKMYHAGPDVFRDEALLYLSEKVEEAEREGIELLIPLDAKHPTENFTSEEIFTMNEQKIQDSVAIIANLSPFRGPSADVGTVWEIGYANALGKPVFGYTSNTRHYEEKIKNLSEMNSKYPIVEKFALADNLMVIHGLASLSDDFQEALGLAKSSIPSISNRNLVYVAGPLFNDSEKRAQEELTELLERNGFQTFLPQRDGLETIEVRPYLSKALDGRESDARRMLAEAIAALDIYQVIERCGSYVGNLNGPILDDGTLSELAFASMAGHPVIFYRNDARTQIDGSTNPLATVGAHVVLNNLEKIPGELRRLNDTVPTFSFIAPPFIRNKIKRGKLFWKALLKIDVQKPHKQERLEQIANVIKELFDSQ